MPKYKAAAAALLVLILTLGLSPALAAGPKPLMILALGDSLTAGYGLSAEQAFPKVLQAALKARGQRVKVINAGVSGDTTGDGRARLDWALADGPQAAIVELGANDALRGLDPGRAEANLAAILGRLQKDRVAVLLAGMYAPRNLGPIYARRFNPIYPRLARRLKVLLYPFFLDGVAGRPELNLADGLHPNPAGVREIVRRIMPFVLRLIERARKGAGSGGLLPAGGGS